MEATRFVGLEKSQDGADLYSAHKEVVSYWTPLHDEIEVFYDNLRGKQWTDEELRSFKKRKKHPVVLNQLKPAERTILGLFIQNRYDVKFAPREPGDQDLSDVLQKLYAYIRSSQDWAYKDIELVRQAWTGGVGYQEFYVRYLPGQEPVLCTQTLNPFSIFWDPESRIPITREDAEFVDRDTWVPFSILQEMWPDIFQSPEEMPGHGDSSLVPNSKVYADRSAQYYDSKNNRYKLTERLYKVRRRAYYAMDPEWNRIDIPEGQDPGRYKQEGYQVFHEMREYLHVAIVCPAWDTSRYLANGPYHCQPRDPETRKIIWPILELAAETLNGDPSGFVKHLVEINRLINSAAATIFHAGRHASTTALLRKKKLFGNDERGKRDFDKNHVDADRVFEVADTADLSADIVPVPKSIVSSDVYKTYEMGDLEFQKNSSAPPALQGQNTEGESGILNAQRIEQGFTQLQPLIANIKCFLRQRAKLAYYYVREYYDYPKTFRVTNDEGKTEFLTINGEEPETDWKGRQTGAIKKVNDVNGAIHDISIEDSSQSPTYRAKVQQQLSDVLTKLGPNVDPELLELLIVEFTRQSDMSQDTKNLFMAHAKRKAEAAKQPPQPPLPEPPKLSFSLKGEDLNTPMGIELMRAFKVLPPEVLDGLAGQGPAPDPNAPAQAAKAGMDLELQRAKVEGQQLDNARKMQDVADMEAEAQAGPPPMEYARPSHPVEAR